MGSFNLLIVLNYDTYVLLIHYGDMLDINDGDIQIFCSCLHRSELLEVESKIIVYDIQAFHHHDEFVLVSLVHNEIL